MPWADRYAVQTSTSRRPSPRIEDDTGVVRIIRITPCVFDEMHTGALFRVFSKSCVFLRDSQNPVTNLPPKCIWRILPVTFHRGHVVTSSPGTTLHFYSERFGGPRLSACSKTQYILCHDIFFFRHSLSFQTRAHHCNYNNNPTTGILTGNPETFRKKMQTCNRAMVSVVPGEEVTT